LDTWVGFLDIMLDLTLAFLKRSDFPRWARMPTIPSLSFGDSVFDYD
jgi:hypothetical protein